MNEKCAVLHVYISLTNIRKLYFFLLIGLRYIDISLFYTVFLLLATIFSISYLMTYICIVNVEKISFIDNDITRITFQ